MICLDAAIVPYRELASPDDVQTRPTLQDPVWVITSITFHAPSCKKYKPEFSIGIGRRRWLVLHLQCRFGHGVHPNVEAHADPSALDAPSIEKLGVFGCVQTCRLESLVRLLGAESRCSVSPRQIAGMLNTLLGHAERRYTHRDTTPFKVNP